MLPIRGAVHCCCLGIRPAVVIVQYTELQRFQGACCSLFLTEQTSCVQRRLAERVTTSQVSWNSISKAWSKEAFFRAVEPAAAETLFTRHVAKLQQDEAADARERAADVRLPRITLPMRASGCISTLAMADQ